MTEQTLEETLEETLNRSIVSVEFRKKDGKTRLMLCTRNLAKVPEHQHEGMHDYRINGEAIIGVYDLDNSAWRSFRKDSVISSTVVL